MRRVVALVLLVALAGCGGAMRADELGRSVETLASAAAEGALVADGAAQDRTKATFTRAHARELGETVEHEAEKLNDATAHGEVADDKASAIDLADRISQQLSQLQTAPDDRAGARRAGDALRRLADQATRLADRTGS
jgi:leucyl aminopeptidase (aminopeptidase T)